jgi:hypothetical protein
MSVAQRIEADIAVIGGSLGGVIAARTALARGMRVALVSEHVWIGGQMTTQGVPPDEHALIEHGGATKSYLAFRDAMRDVYRAQTDFVDRSEMTPGLCNPGDGWVSRLCFEPKHALGFFEGELKVFEASGQLRHVRLASLESATRDERRALSAIVKRDNGERVEIAARVFLDATDTGLLLAKARHPYRVGKESRSQFNEPNAPDVACADDQQPITAVFALVRAHPHVDDVAASAPTNYAFWRDYRLPQYSHSLFSEMGPGSGVGESMRLPFFANDARTLDWWRYRRVVSAKQWRTPRDEVSLVNWAQNDYALRPLIDGDEDSHEAIRGAFELSLAFAHWLRFEAPRADGGRGYSELRFEVSAFGTSDGIAQQIYVRESRRMVSVETLWQNNIAARYEGDFESVSHPQSVGVAWYNMDIHPTCVSGHGVNARVRPFVLPLGAFVSEHLDNLIPACKNIGVTHLVNACTRVHPAEWLIGEVAAHLATQCAIDRVTPHALYENAHAVARFRETLSAHGIPLSWSADVLRHLPKTAQHG